MKYSPAWPAGKCCAVSLTYDDAFESHWREVAPELELRGFFGTFYTPIRARFWNHIEKWRKVAQAGHELGNHTVFHPCRYPSDGPEYTAFKRHDLSRYTLDEFRTELEVANAFLELVDGRSTRTYGNTCHHTTVGRDHAEASMTPVLKDLFPAARGTKQMAPAANDLQSLDLYNVGCVSSHSFDTLKTCIEHAARTGGWLIVCLHDVGDNTESLRIARSEHAALLEHLKTNSDIWVAPVVDVATQLRTQEQASARMASR